MARPIGRTSAFEAGNVGSSPTPSTEPKVIWKPQAGPQTALLTCPFDEVFYGGARGGGKSDGLLGFWMKHAAKYGPHAQGIVIRRTLTELEDLIDRARAIFLPGGATYAISKKTFHMPGGASLRMRFVERLEDVSRYQGHGYTFVGIEEAGDWPTQLDEFGQPTQKAVAAMRATMRSATGARPVMVLTGNPGGVGHDWLKHQFIDPAPPYQPHRDPLLNITRVFIPARLEDNAILMENDPEYEVRLAASGPAWLVRAWRYGDWNARPEGALFHVEQFKRYKELPSDVSKPWDTWDTAFKVKQEDDYSAGIKMTANASGVYLLDVFRRKVEYPELRRAVVDFAAKNPPEEVGIEDKASGQSIIQELRRSTGLPIKAIKAEQDKVARANSVLPLIEAGKVWLPESAPWTHDFIEELALFPHGSHDDQVDAFVHGLRRYLFSGAHTGLMDFYRAEVERMKREKEPSHAKG